MAKHEDHFIERASTQYYEVLIEIWETSVRATHHFLNEEDIVFFKTMMKQYLDTVKLFTIKDTSAICGFVGLSDDKLEMLFIHPAYTGKGLGKKILKYAIDEMNVRKVDVNEQNENAVRFYLHNGFRIIERSELDSSGKPYPILHLQLK